MSPDKRKGGGTLEKCRKIEAQPVCSVHRRREHNRGSPEKVTILRLAAVGGEPH